MLHFVYLIGERHPILQTFFVEKPQETVVLSYKFSVTAPNEAALSIVHLAKHHKSIVILFFQGQIALNKLAKLLYCLDCLR